MKKNEFEKRKEKARKQLQKFGINNVQFVERRNFLFNKSANSVALLEADEEDLITCSTAVYSCKDDRDMFNLAKQVKDQKTVVFFIGDETFQREDLKIDGVFRSYAGLKHVTLWYPEIAMK